MLCLLAATALAGCGTQDGGVTSAVMTAARGVLSGDSGSAQTSLRATLTPAAVARVGQPVLYTALPSREVEALLLVSGRNRDTVTWRTQDNVALSLQQHLVAATYGLGNDLTSAYLDDTLAALRGERDTAVRVHRYLDGERQVFLRSFVCTYSEQELETDGSRVSWIVREHCDSADIDFENRYWRAEDGTIWKSRQWIGPKVGYLEMELLAPG